MKKIFLSFVVTTTILFTFLQSCNKEESSEYSVEEINFENLPYKTLSEYGFFSGELNNLTPAERVLIYEPASSLFTDYAHKSRFIWMPKGFVADINLDDKEGRMDFPNQTIIIKAFYYPEDFRKPEGKRRIIETRLMVKDNDKWVAYPYIWNDEQTDAELKVAGGETEVTWIDEAGIAQKIDYIIPNKNQCKSCHNFDEGMMPIGVKAMHLNHEFNYGETTINQLEMWHKMGYLKEFLGSESYASVINYHDESMPLEKRAMAYLDINCAHCHNPNGPASTSGLVLTYFEENPTKLGIFKTPIAAGFGAGSFKYDIYPSKGDKSILTHRMSSNEVGAAMPEIGRVSVHKEGVALIKEWINAMDENDYL